MARFGGSTARRHRIAWHGMARLRFLPFPVFGNQERTVP
jgi:hypothetical protein